MIQSGETQKLIEFLDALPKPEEPDCQYLTDGEDACRGQYEHYKDQKFVRYCPHKTRKETRQRISAEERSLEGLLAKCGYDPKRFPEQRSQSISECLYKAIDPRRPIRNLGKLLTVTLAISKENPPQRNVAFLGPPGLAKTSAQLMIHFARLESGIRSQFVTSVMLRDLFQRMSSGIPEMREEAKRQFHPLLSAESIIWSDVGDTETSSKREFAQSLLELLEKSNAAWVISSNLSINALKQHPDIGERVLSRLLADRYGNPAEVIGLEGPDQRTRNSRKNETFL